MYAKLDEFEKRYEELDALLSTPEVLNDRERFKQISKERSDLGDVVEQYRTHKRLEQERLDNREMLAGVYQPRWVPTRLRDGRTVTAVTFVVDTAHCQYCGDLPIEHLVEL